MDRTRRTWLSAGSGVWLRLGFLGAAAGFGLYGFHGQGRELWHSFTSVGVPQVALALGLTLLGLLVAGSVWCWLLLCFGQAVPFPEALAVFNIGQLGKYIPGSVWVVMAQAKQAGRLRVEGRVVVATSLTYLGIIVASAGALGSASALLVSSIRPTWLSATWWWISLLLVLVASVISLVPAVVRWLGTRIAGGPELELNVRRALACYALLGLSWLLYAAALRLLVPSTETAELAVLIPAFTLSYVAGVLVVIAPAGLGAREAVLVALTAPTLGLAPAGALALLARLVHAVADVVVVVLTSTVARWLASRRPREEVIADEG